MPGLNQLKKFSEDILQLGNEPERRKAKGEALPRVTFPENASEADDSGQFLFGLPQEGDVAPDSTGGAADAAADADEEIDIDALLANALGDQTSQPSSPDLEPAVSDPVSEAIPEAVPDTASDSSIPSLDDDIFGDISSFGSSDGTLDALADFEADTADLFSDPAIDDLTAPEVPPAEELTAEEPAAADPFADISFDEPPVADIEPAADATGGFDDFSFNADDVASADSLEPAADMDVFSDFEQADASPAASPLDDEFAISDDTQILDMNDDLPPSMNEGPAESDDPFAGMGEFDFSTDDTAAAEPAELTADDDVPGFEEPASLDDVAELEDAGLDDFALDDTFGTSDAAESTDTADMPDLDDTPAPSFDAGGDTDFSMPDFDLGGDGGTEGSDSFDLPPVDGLDSMDFSTEPGSGDSESASSDDDFAIPGFSDFDMIPQDAGPAKTETKATSNKQKDEPPPLKTELTDSEYKTFLENLDYYPLNVRIALQDMIVKNEFTDDAVMEVIHKVIKKIPARQLSAHLEKLLDISLPVPVNYEKRTAAEYEAYKQSLSYQLRNKIIPIAIASFVSLLLCTLFGWLIAKFVVTPVKAELLYKEGYELISNGMYPQSEQKFNEAVSYKAKKKWYFNYARSYRDARQYDRSAGIYQRLLNRFEHDKTAGLEYANMELYDRANYQRAEEVVRREILDYHIDNPEGMLLLGDIFLEWATNSDSAKFDDARYAYEDLMHVHGQTNLSLSRMLRYYIRTDQIPRVLELKSYFYPRMQKKQVMENKDQVELAGYMLDKMFGYLSPKNEYLRAYIEDVRDLLEIAIKSCEASGDMESYPEAVYNYGRYFVETANPDSAVTVLTRALELFDSASKKSHSRTLKNINTYRLLGEIYTSNKKYIDAEAMYAEGLTLFEYEKKNNALVPDENVGLLYADMADIDYFLSGDYDAALRNYESAINNMNDTPSIRYRVGWIQYANGNYSEALGSFIKVITDKPSEKNALFALGNTLAFRNSTAAAAGYYEKLLDELDLEIQRADISLTRVQDIDQEDLFTLYMKATNNLGVALSQIADQTSDSRKNAEAISQFSNSIQAYDALHRNPETYTRLAGSNLAEMNLKYLTVPGSKYEPEFYPELSRVLTDELMLRQADE
ncbi:MAG: tetratricopeptide repeat protein [Treponema sp.]|nr:tetratricopeptide repeat protein [Candidatus Treponema caballi]